MLSNLNSVIEKIGEVSSVCFLFYCIRKNPNITQNNYSLYLHCALAAAQCIVIGPVCLFVAGCVGVCVCGWVGLLPR